MGAIWEEEVLLLWEEALNQGSLLNIVAGNPHYAYQWDRFCGTCVINFVMSQGFSLWLLLGLGFWNGWLWLMASSASLSSVTVPGMILYSGCTTQLPHVERNKCVKWSSRSQGYDGVWGWRDLVVAMLSPQIRAFGLCKGTGWVRFFWVIFQGLRPKELPGDKWQEQ